MRNGCYGEIRMDRNSEKFSYDEVKNALAVIFDAIPSVKYSKERIPKGNQYDIRPKEIIREISIERLIGTLKNRTSLESNHVEFLYTVVFLLNALGIINIHYDRKSIRVSPSSLPASSLLKNLGGVLRNNTHRESPINSAANIEPIISVVQEQINNRYLDIHLLLSNLISFDFAKNRDEPLFELRIISVLIKGTRKKRFSDEKENVYLHVYKDEWGKYALIGSKQGINQSDEDTARLALDEDLLNNSDKFVLAPSGVDDVVVDEPDFTLGMYTRYYFNLYVVENFHDVYLEGTNLKYAWFTI